MHFPSRLQHYGHTALRDDLVAAFIVAVLLIPQSLAYALLAGLPPQAGVYASLLPLLAYAALGSSHVNSVGPAAVLSLLTAQGMAGAVAHHGVSPGDAALVMAVEVGALLGTAAVIKLDALSALLSVPVLQGFSIGAAVSIALSQLPVLLGSPAQGFNAQQVASSWWRSNVPGHAATTAFGLGALGLLLLARRHAAPLAARWLTAGQASLLSRCVPLALILVGILLGGLVSAGDRGVALVGALPAFALSFTPPPWGAALWRELLPSAAIVALVTFVSSLAVAESLGLQQGTPVSARRELTGLAAANLVAGLSGGMPVGGSFSRTAVNIEAGVRTRMAGVWTALFMALAMLLFAGPLSQLPKAVLAATIVVAVLASAEWRAVLDAWRFARSEAAVMVAVAAITVFHDALWALATGVGVSIALLLQRSARPHAVLVGRMPGTEHYRNVLRYPAVLEPTVLGLRIDESLLFTNARQLPGVVASHLDKHPDTVRVLLQMSPVNRIDFSGLAALRSLQDILAKRGVQLDLSEVKGPVLDQLRQSGWSQWFTGRLFLSHHQGVVGQQGMPPGG